MKKIKDFRATIQSKRQIASDVFVIELFLPDFSGLAEPGQFVMVKPDVSYYPFLRRPYSIFECEKNHITLLLKVVGAGSKILAEKKRNEKLDILGPLGKGFPLPLDKYAVLLAGGIGIAPIWFLARKLGIENKPFIVIFGEKTATKLSNEVLKTFGKNVRIVTDDGSLGHKATVSGFLPIFFDNVQNKSCVLYACGPQEMLKESLSFGEKHSLPVYISLEERMACGMGICMGCSVKKKKETGYFTICRDGPVFNANSVEL